VNLGLPITSMEPLALLAHVPVLRHRSQRSLLQHRLLPQSRGPISCSMPPSKAINFLGAERGVNCDTTCEKEGLSCLSSASAYKMVNTCEALKQVFGENCKTCQKNEGEDQPALDVDKELCLQKSDESVFHCIASHPKTRRLCLCA